MSFKLKNLKKLENNKVLLELEISNSYLKKSESDSPKYIDREG